MSEHPNRMIASHLEHIRYEVIRFARVGFYCYRLDGEIVFMDKGALHLLDLADLDPREVVGRNISSLFVHEQPPESLRDLTKTHNQVSRFEYHYRTLSGKERWVYHNTFLFRDPDTGEQFIQVFSEDITDLKQTALALESSERRFRTLAEHLPHGVAIIKGEPSRIVYANPVLGDIVGAAPDALIGAENETLRGYVHPDDLSPLIHDPDAWGRTEKKSPYREIRVMRPDASMRWVLIGSVPTEFDGAPARLITMIDITGRKDEEEKRRRFEAKLRQTQRLESLGVLAGGIAHDFNNLLTTIIGRSELALMRMKQGSTVRGYIEDAVNAAGKAAELCKSLLTHAGRDRMESNPIDIHALIQETNPLLEIILSANAHLKYNPDGNSLTVMGDKAQLRQVLFNLVANASESLREHPGVIRMALEPVTISRDAPVELHHGVPLTEGRYVRLDVSDTGAGMDVDTQSRIFEPFYSTKATGRGLGLATVMGIVRGHGGGIGLASAPGCGASFSVYLPLADASVSVKEAAVKSSVVGWGAGRVLVADDDPSVLNAIRSMVEMFGFDVLCATDGIEAVDLFCKNDGQLACVVLDVSMPCLDGFDAFLRIREHHADVPVLFVSGFDARNACDEFKNDPRVRFLQKPFHMESLAATLKNLLGKAMCNQPGSQDFSGRKGPTACSIP